MPPSQAVRLLVWGQKGPFLPHTNGRQPGSEARRFEFRMCLCKPDRTAYHGHVHTTNGNMLPAPWEIRVHMQFVDTRQNAVKLTQWSAFTDQGTTLTQR